MWIMLMHTSASARRTGHCSDIASSRSGGSKFGASRPTHSPSMAVRAVLCGMARIALSESAGASVHAAGSIANIEPHAATAVH
jgi:hypothetical protein